MITSPWIRNSKFDLILICSVGLWSTLLAWYLNNQFNLQLGPWTWLLLVVGLDAAHVYSTLYRTYFDKTEQSFDRKLLIFLPGIAFVLSAVIASYSLALFWKLLAYLAVFHFSRQQVGFLQIYNRRHEQNRALERFDSALMYVLTLGSVLIWHTQGQKNFNWFVRSDFFYIADFSNFGFFLKVSYWLFFSCFVLKETWGWWQTRQLNLAKDILMISTAASWYFGIVYFNSDFIFTISNVATHGIPYLALVWSAQEKRKTVFSFIPLFIFLVVAFAFIEESLWDSLVWREHEVFFSSFYFLPQIQNSWWIAIATALLVVPQFTHYLLDGFIWKIKGTGKNWI